MLRGVLAGGLWNGFLLAEVRGEVVPCRFCGEADGDGHLSLEMKRDRSIGLGAFSGMAGCLRWPILAEIHLGEF